MRVLAGASMFSCVPMRPFSDEACDFLDDISKLLMKDARAKAFPDVISFAYWCRRGNVQREKAKRAERLGDRLGRGLAFHIAPGNVPVNFAFSYAFSLLAGNATIVRCPSKAFDQVEVILSAMRTAFEHHPAIEERSVFVTYPSSGSTTALLSGLSDVRVIWGGDATVQSVRSLPSKPRCVDIAFADRYSIALFSARAVLDLDDESLAKLARGFFNDTYLMDQNACSSPQTVLWVAESADIDAACKRFWNAVEEYAQSHYQLQAAVAVDKHVQLCSEVACGVVDGCEESTGVLTTAWLASVQPLSADLRGVGGFFHEKSVSGLADVGSEIDEKYQTLVQFGFEMESLRDEVIRLGLTGIDRIVPVGKAMDIGLVWDGYDLIDAMSRIVHVG